MKTGIKNSLILLGVFAVFLGSATSSIAAYFSTTPISRCENTITRTLQVGSQNNEVLILQKMLFRGGFLHASPNGYFGAGTRSAVRQFQIENGIQATGMVGEATRNAVNERLCDMDVNGDSLSYSIYGYNSGITYVDNYDPYARIISPNTTNPTVYATPQEYIPAPRQMSPSGVITPYTSPAYPLTPSSPVLPVSASSQVQSTHVVYNPSVGYTYGIVPQSGSLTITSPVVGSQYKEGDMVTVVWSSSNINALQYNVLLENTSTGQSKIVAATSNGNTISFVLTKEVLDAVCLGICDNNQQGSFRVVMTSPVTDIAGITSAFRAAVSNITIKRPYGFTGTVSVTASKTPVNSGELFKLYVNIPTGASWNAGLYGNYSLKIRAICPSGVQASIAGTLCGQEFSIPFAPVHFQQEIPTTITNSTWYRQDVVYEIVVTNLLGQVIGTARTTVVANAAAFSW